MKSPRQSLPAAVKAGEEQRPARRKLPPASSTQPRSMAPAAPEPAKPMASAAPPKADGAGGGPVSAARTSADDAFPGFKSTAIDRPARGQHAARQLAARLALREVFAPSQPVTERARFAGRLSFLAELIATIEERLSHVVLYGPRGMGKTSLLHIFTAIARESQYRVIYGSCSAHARFDDMFRTFLGEIPLRFLNSVSPGDAEVAGAVLADRLPEGRFDARQLSDLLANVAGTRVIIILDEFDRIENQEFRQSVAELIKNLSDRTARVQLILSGVAANLTELIGYIPSIRRNIIGMPIPRMSRDEVATLVAMGEKAASISFEPAAHDLVAEIANGSPYLVRLLCHHASLAAVDDDRDTVTADDIASALDRIIAESEGRMDRRVAHAARQLDFAGNAVALAAVAKADATADGWFTPEDVMAQLPAATDRKDVVAFVDALLVRSGLVGIGDGSHEGEFRFVDEGLPVYLWTQLSRVAMRGKTVPLPGPTARGTVSPSSALG